jgi:hypothetical protein
MFCSKYRLHVYHITCSIQNIGYMCVTSNALFNMCYHSYDDSDSYYIYQNNAVIKPNILSDICCNIEVTTRSENDDDDEN